jgi:hypothetical protein
VRIGSIATMPGFKFPLQYRVEANRLLPTGGSSQCSLPSPVLCYPVQPIEMCICPNTLLSSDERAASITRVSHRHVPVVVVAALVPAVLTEPLGNAVAVQQD